MKNTLMHEAHGLVFNAIGIFSRNLLVFATSVRRRRGTGRQ